MIDFEAKEKVSVLLEKARSSYITKEEFINIINTLEFEAIKCADINLITGYTYDEEDGVVRPLSKHIEMS